MSRTASVLTGFTLLLMAAALSNGHRAPNADAHLIRHPDKPTLTDMQNRERSQQKNLYHSRYVCHHGGGKHKRWSCNAVGWLERELAETRAALRARQVRTLAASWGPWAFPDPCLREISRRETAGTYSPTIWNYAGSGAYGIGQALPASKMRPFGADYMTNPWTQLRWMVAYVNGRYGGSCAALSFHNQHGYY